MFLRSKKVLQLRLITTRAWQCAGPPVMESPFPVLIACGEGLGIEAYELLSQKLSQAGYNGVAFEFPSEEDTPDAGAKMVAQVIEENKLIPPVMIAHSMSTYVAYKFLESYSFKGLVLLNPLPPNSKRAAGVLKEKYDNSISSGESGDDVSQVCTYYGGTGEDNADNNDALLPSTSSLSSFALSSMPFPVKMLAHIAASDQVLLEPGAVPALVCVTPQDSDILSKEEGEEKALLEFFHINVSNDSDDDNNLMRIQAGDVSMGRASVLNDEESVSRIVEWIDTL